MRNRLASVLCVAAVALPLAAGAAVTENFDGVTAPALPTGWTSTVVQASGADIPWTSRDVGYAVSTPNAVFVADYNDYADVSLVSPTYTLPATGTVTVSFQHSYVLWAPDASALDNGVFNGGVLEISVNGGPYADIVTAGGAFTAGGYNAALDPGNDNPIAPSAPLARPVWGGNSGGFVLATATLPAAASGGTVSFRWRLGTEGGGSSYDTHSGWTIDDFSCDQCSSAVVDLIFANGFESP